MLNTDEVVHVLLVAFAGLVLLISLLAYANRRDTRYMFLSLAFTFLALSQVVELIETLFLSNQLVYIPLTGMSFNSTRYHVDRLTKAGEIVRVEDGGYTRLYP